MDQLRKKPKSRCPRCKSMRLSKRLDGARWCARCGQRILADGRLVPSADRRSDAPPSSGQFILL